MDPVPPKNPVIDMVIWYRGLGTSCFGLPNMVEDYQRKDVFVKVFEWLKCELALNFNISLPSRINHGRERWGLLLFCLLIQGFFETHPHRSSLFQLRPESPRWP